MKTKNYAIILSAFIIVALALFGCSPKTVTDNNSSNSQAQGGQTQTVISNQVNDANVEIITVKDFSFIPAAITIKKGTTVRWMNQDSTAHSIKSDKINSPVFGQGDSFEFKFDESGTYDYICGIHTSMKGTIIVQ